MSSSMKRRQRISGVSNSRVNVGRERRSRREDESVQQEDGVDELSLRTQRRSTTYSRARGQA
jgi:hypothetical protein